MRRAPAPARVEDMFEQIKSKLPGAPRFLLCLLPERKNSDIYGLFLFLFIFYFFKSSLCFSACPFVFAYTRIVLNVRALEAEVSF